MMPLRRLTGLVLAGLLAASCSAPPRPPVGITPEQVVDFDLTPHPGATP